MTQRLGLKPIIRLSSEPKRPGSRTAKRGFPTREATATDAGETKLLVHRGGGHVTSGVKKAGSHWHLWISIATDANIKSREKAFFGVPTLSSSLNVQLTDALRRYVDERVSDKDVYATPGEYIRDLIRRDMQDRTISLNVLEGLDDLKHGGFSSRSTRDFKDED